MSHCTLEWVLLQHSVTQRGESWLPGQPLSNFGTSEVAITGTVGSKGLDLELLIIQLPTPNCSYVQVLLPLGLRGAGGSTEGFEHARQALCQLGTFPPPL